MMVGRHNPNGMDDLTFSESCGLRVNGYVIGGLIIQAISPFDALIDGNQNKALIRSILVVPSIWSDFNWIRHHRDHG